MIDADVVVKWNADKFTRQVDEQAEQSAKEIADKIEADAKAAAPVITGELRDSIKAYKSRIDDIGYIVDVGVFYGSFVELGTSRIKSNPFLRRALEKNAKQYGYLTGKKIRSIL